MAAAHASSSRTASTQVGSKRIRAPVAVDCSERLVHQLIVRQLVAQGYVDAASAVQRSTRCETPFLDLDPLALQRLVHRGSVAERLASDHHRASALRAPADDVVDVLSARSAYQSMVPLSSVPFTELYKSHSLERMIRSLAFSPLDGSLIACGTSHGSVALFSTQLALEAYRVAGIQPAGTGINQPTGGPAGKRSAPAAILNGPAATADALAKGVLGGGSTNFAHVRTMSHRHEQSVEWVGFHPTVPALASGGRDGTLHLTTYTEARTLSLLPPPKTEGGTGGGVAGRPLPLVQQDTYPIRGASFHPSGDYLAYATDHNVLRLVDLNVGERFMPPSDGGSHQAALTDIAFAPVDGRVVATTSHDGAVKLTDLRTGLTEWIRRAAHSSLSVTSVAFSHRQTALLTSGMDGQTKLWDLRKQNVELEAFGEPRKVVRRVVSRFAHDENTIFLQEAPGPASTLTGESSAGGASPSTAGGNQVSVIDVYSGVVVARLQHAHDVRAMAVCPSAMMCVTGGDDFRMRLWSPAAVAVVFEGGTPLPTLAE